MKPGGITKNTQAGCLAGTSFFPPATETTCLPSDTHWVAPFSSLWLGLLPPPSQARALTKKVAGTGRACVSPSPRQRCSEQGAGVISIRVWEPRHLARWGRGGTLKAFSSLLGEGKISFRAL